MLYEMEYVIDEQIAAAWMIKSSKKNGIIFQSWLSEPQMPSIVRLMPLGVCVPCYIHSLYSI